MALQEEVEQRTVTLIVNTAKLTERELQKAISFDAASVISTSYFIPFVCSCAHGRHLPRGASVRHQRPQSHD